MKLTKTIFISFLILAIATSLYFFLPSLVGAANTGGNVFLGFIKMLLTGGGLCGVVCLFYYLVKRRDSAKDVLKKEQNLLNQRKTQLVEDLGGDGATINISVDEITEEEVEAQSENHSDNSSEGLNWTVKPATKKPPKSEMQNVIEDAIETRNKTVLVVFKILALVFVLFLGCTMLIETGYMIADPEDAIYKNEYELKSLPNVMGYYIHCSDTNKSKTTDDGSYSFKFTYETNSKTKGYPDYYIEYLEDEGFAYDSHFRAYTKVNPKDTNYMYAVKITDSKNSVTISYYYQKI